MTRLIPVLVLVSLTACARSGVPLQAASDGLAFDEASEQTGLRFRHFNGASGEFYLPEIMGPGVALFDADNDGDLDVFLPQGDFLDSGKTMANATFPLPDGTQPGSRLFRNDLVPGGTLHFTDITEPAHAGVRGHAMGTAVGDYDNNGTTDLLVTGVGRSTLLRNQGDGTFTDVTGAMGVVDHDLSASAAFVDYDHDGWLDLFVAHYVHGTTVERKKCRNPAAELDYCGPQAFPPSVARLYHNEQGRRFANVTAVSGIGSSAGPGLGVQIADFDSDGWPDIYVANDGAASFLWLNQRNGTFREGGLEMGVAYSADGRAQAGMGIAVGDVDNDGREEVLKTNLIREGANIYQRNASGVYSDVSNRVNLLGPTLGRTGFGVGLADFDNDGWLDAFFANGAVVAMEQQHGQPYPYRQLNVLLRNVAGLFTLVPADTGPLAEPFVSRGVAFGDLDNDGDVDFVVANNNGPTRLYLNRLSARGFAHAHWLRVRLETPTSGRRGFQALVRIQSGARVRQIRRIDPGGSYLSASDPVAHFGLGEDAAVDTVRVDWPDGSRSTHHVNGVDRELRIRQPES